MKSNFFSYFVAIFFLLSAFNLEAQTIEILTYNSYIDPETKHWLIIGMVGNSSEFSYRDVLVRVKGYNKNNTLIFEDKVLTSMPLAPLQDTPFIFDNNLKKKRGIDRLELDVIAARAGDYLDSFNYSFSDFDFSFISSSYAILTGIIYDGDEFDEDYIRIALIGYDSDDVIVYLDFTSPKRNLSEFDSAFFEFLINRDISDRIARYRYIGYGFTTEY